MGGGVCPQIPAGGGVALWIGGHPSHIEEENIKRLVAAGLENRRWVSGGSPRVRKRSTTAGGDPGQIWPAGESGCSRVPVVVYDLILDHPFRDPRRSRETLEFCLKIPNPFRLQLHGLSLLPGAAIRRMAVEKGGQDPCGGEAEFRRPLLEQYRDIHWWRRGRAPG